MSRPQDLPDSERTYLGEVADTYLADDLRYSTGDVCRCERSFFSTHHAVSVH